MYENKLQQYEKIEMENDILKQKNKDLEDLVEFVETEKRLELEEMGGKLEKTTTNYCPLTLTTSDPSSQHPSNTITLKTTSEVNVHSEVADLRSVIVVHD